MRSAPPLVALALAATVLLSGCVPQAPDINPPPELTTEPVFASDEEALAAATDAYKAYLAMSDLISQEGGKDPERIAPFVTEEWLPNEVEALQSIEQRNRKLIGNTAFDTVSVQQVQQLADGVAVVVIYACIDFTNSWLVESDGSRVIAAGGQTRWPFEVSFVGKSASELAVERHEEWSSSDYC